MNRKQQAMVDKFDAQREQIEARLQMLKAQAKEASAERRIDINEHVEKLEARKKTAQARLQELRGASEDAWEEIADGAKRAWETLGDSMDRALDRFS